jgi:hypothetical protein
MIPREILKIIRQIELRTSRIGLVWVAQATGLCRPATRRTEWWCAAKLTHRRTLLEASSTFGRRVADRNGRVARSTLHILSVALI